jgi:hypothetical protein
MGSAAQDAQDSGGEGVRVGRVEAGGFRHRTDIRAGTASGAALENFGYLDMVGLFKG